MEKVCTKCLISKPITQFFDKNKSKTSWCKKCLSINQNKRWVDRKLKVIEIMGGKCQLCGYNKNYSVLEFHHIDQNAKDVDWSKARQMSWSKMMEEIEKCTLLCANCHRELHHPHALLDQQITTNLNRDYNYSPPQPTGECPICNKKIYSTKYCSKQCSSISRRKCNRPTKEELIQLTQLYSIAAIGRQFNVSDNTIRKWLKYFDINSPKRKA